MIMKPVEGFEYQLGEYVAAMDCPTRAGEMTLHRAIGRDATGRQVVKTHSGKVRVIDPAEPHVFVNDPSQFDLALWQATLRLDLEGLAAKMEVDAQVRFLRDWLREDLAIRISLGLHGMRDDQWRTQQAAAKHLVESGEARFLYQDKQTIFLAQGVAHLDFEPVSLAPAQVIWMAGTSAGSGIAKLLGWLKGNPVVYRFSRWAVEVVVVEGGTWTKPLAGNPDTWIRERLAEQAEVVRRTELTNAMAELRARLSVEIAIRPNDDSERLLLDALEREGVVVCLDRDYVLTATN